MPDICLYFQVHQPLRLRHYTVFDRSHQYFDESRNASICKEVANKCYLPANRLILKLIRRFSGEFKVAYSLTGILLEQLQRYSPEVLSTFDALAETGCVEFLAETYYHSLSFLYSPQEFIEQVNKHIETIEYLFGQRPRVFRNTELIYNNDLAALVESTGNFDAILSEGADHILGARSPDFIYRPQGCSKLKLLLKDYSLSDDIAFRFSNRTWSEWPLTPEKFAGWINNINGNGNVVNLLLDYETLGEHQSGSGPSWLDQAETGSVRRDERQDEWQDAGIFRFMEQLPHEVLKHSGNNFRTPSDVVRTYDPIGTVDAPHLISWADAERDLSAWLGNPMQSNAIYELYRLENKIKQTADEEIISDWRRLQTSDHFYYMCTKFLHASASPDARRGSGSDEDVHSYFSPYDSPYDSYINFMNVLGHLHDRCSRHTEGEQFCEPSQNKNPPLAQGLRQTV